MTRTICADPAGQAGRLARRARARPIKMSLRCRPFIFRVVVKPDSENADYPSFSVFGVDAGGIQRLEFAAKHESSKYRDAEELELNIFMGVCASITAILPGVTSSAGESISVGTGTLVLGATTVAAGEGKRISRDTDISYIESKSFNQSSKFSSSGKEMIQKAGAKSRPGSMKVKKSNRDLAKAEEKSRSESTPLTDSVLLSHSAKPAVFIFLKAQMLGLTSARAATTVVRALPPPN